MHSSLKKQLAEEANSALRQVQSNIEAEVKAAPVFISEASSIAYKPKCRMLVDGTSETLPYVTPCRTDCPIRHPV